MSEIYQITVINPAPRIVSVVVTAPQQTITSVVVSPLGVPPGGTAGQVLKKNGDGSGAYDWEDSSEGVAPFIHSQTEEATEWIINHNRGYEPVIELLTVGGVKFFGEIVHVSFNQARVYLTTAAAGKARCV